MRIFKIFLTLIFLGIVSFANDTNTTAQDQIVSKAPITFTLEDINSNTYHITDTPTGLKIKELEGKVVFLAFFGHRCPPCRMEIPGFIEFTKDKNYSSKATILAFEVQGLDENTLKEFVKDVGINYNVISGSKYYDFISYITQKTNWGNMIPFMVVLDQNGNIVNYGSGLVTPEELKYITDELTKQQIISNAQENNNTKQNQTGEKHE